MPDGSQVSRSFAAKLVSKVPASPKFKRGEYFGVHTRDSLDNNQCISASEMGKKLNFGFGKIELNCLDGILKFDCNKSLHKENVELENLLNVYYLFDADEEEIMEYTNRFGDEKIIPQYLSLLRETLKNNPTLEFRIALPEGYYKNAYFSRQQSIRVKKTMDNKLPAASYEEMITGVLTCLDFENRISPCFSLRSTIGDKVYNGVIDPSLAENISELNLNFKGREYKCRCKVIFTPGSPVSPETYEYTLLEIKEI